MKQRMISGVIAAIAFLMILLVGNLLFALAITLLGCIGFYEFIKMFRLKPKGAMAIVGYVGLVWIIFPWHTYMQLPITTFTAKLWTTLFVLMLITVLSKNKLKLDQAMVVLLGIVYIGLGCHFMIVTRLLDDGLIWSLFVFLCIWMSDTGAYFSGRYMGKKLLWPVISPKKTVEGAIGAIVFAMLTALVFAAIYPELMPYHHALIIGILISIVAQLGDLIQSAYKRANNVKDSGRILPGHGGMLDRCDSWLIVFPFVHLLTLLPIS